MAAVKRSPDYHEMRGIIPPDPIDSTVSKRKWEWSVQVWRKALRDNAVFDSASNGQDIKDLSIDDIVLDDAMQCLLTIRCSGFADSGLIRQARPIM